MNVMSLKEQLPDPAAADIIKQAEEREKERRKRMSTAKALRLPPLLEQRRQEHLITDGYFRVQPVYDRVFVYQLLEDHFKDGVTEGGIVLPDMTVEREKASAPRGVLVAAGATAMDQLASNGIQLGHIVRYLFHAPWSIPVARGERVTVLRAGDIIASEDLAEQLRAGKVKFEFDPEAVEHQFKDESGRMWLPKNAWRGDDY